MLDGIALGGWVLALCILASVALCWHSTGSSHYYHYAFHVLLPACMYVCKEVLVQLFSLAFTVPFTGRILFCS